LSYDSRWSSRLDLNQREPLRFRRLIRPGRYARSSVGTTSVCGASGAWRHRLVRGAGPGAGTRRHGTGGDRSRRDRRRGVLECG